MDRIREEKGGTLLIVLLILVLFTVMGLGALAMNISVTKQLGKKEDHVQARHLAEMGILHYKAEVDRSVKKFNGDSSNYLVYKDGKIDSELSKERYNTRLCETVRGVSQPGKAVETGAYSVTRDPVACTEELIEIPFSSHGKSKVDKHIAATLTIAPPFTGSPPSDQPIGEPPSKPSFPEESLSTVPTLDDIKQAINVRVENGTTKKEPFSTSANVEILESLNMPKKNTWTFHNNLVVNGDVNMETAGNNRSTLTVMRDFYISGAFSTANHNPIIVNGDLIVRGTTDFGTKASLTVSGNALFNGKVSVQPHADITIEQDAYFTTALQDVNQNANICVKGDIFLWGNDGWSPYTSKDVGFTHFKKSCLNSDPGDTEPGNGFFNWRVLDKVNPDYGV